MNNQFNPETVMPICLPTSKRFNDTKRLVTSVGMGITKYRQVGRPVSEVGPDLSPLCRIAVSQTEMDRRSSSPVQPGGSILHSYWSRSKEARLSLVESFRVLLAPAVLSHKEQARQVRFSGRGLRMPELVL